MTEASVETQFGDAGEHSMTFGTDGGAVAVTGVDDGLVGSTSKPSRIERRMVGSSL